MRWLGFVLGGVVLTAAAVVSCAYLIRTDYLQDPKPTGTLRFARTHEADGEGGRLGAACGIGDLDGDGRADYAIGSPSAGRRPNVRGEVRVHSGATGEVRTTLEAPEGSSGFGESIASLPDVDGDGSRDLAIGAPGWRRDISSPGETVRVGGVVEIRSGRSGRCLRTMRAGPSAFQFGSSLASLEDPGGTHPVLLLVGADEDGRDGVGADAVSAFSPTDGSLVYRTEGSPEHGIGGRLSICGDLDGDRCPDFAACGGESVLLVSGRSGAVLHTLLGKYPAQAFPSDDRFDFDPDGCPDVVVGEHLHETMARDGRLVVYSGRDGRPLWEQRYFAAEGTALSAGPGSAAGWLAVAGYRSLSIFSLPGTTPVSVLSLESGWLPSVTALGDVDGDGKADLLLAGQGPRDWVGLVSSKDLPHVLGDR